MEVEHKIITGTPVELEKKLDGFTEHYTFKISAVSVMLDNELTLIVELTPKTIYITVDQGESVDIQNKATF